MKQHSIPQIVEKIMNRTGMSQQEIADKIKYSRSHFNVIMNSGRENPRVEGRLKEQFSDILSDMYTTPSVTKPITVRSNDGANQEKRLRDLEEKIKALEAKLAVLVDLMKRS